MGAAAASEAVGEGGEGGGEEPSVATILQLLSLYGLRSVYLEFKIWDIRINLFLSQNHQSEVGAMCLCLLSFSPLVGDRTRRGCRRPATCFPSVYRTRVQDRP